MPPVIRPFPDIELLVVNYLQGQLGDSYRVCTDLPDKMTQVTIRVTRVSGANRDIAVDRPVVDLDVFSSPDGGRAEASGTAYMLLDMLTALRNLVTPDGVVQYVSTVTGPRWLPDINQDLTRFSASYEFHAHGVAQ